MKIASVFASSFILTVGLVTVKPTFAASQEYQEAYKCAMESYTSGYGAGPAAMCVGNSRDPSRLEEKAYKDAERDFNAGKTRTSAAASGCPFAYATYEAIGTMADNNPEGLQTFRSLSEVAPWMSGGREISFYDAQGKQVDSAVVNTWFAPGGKYGNPKVSAAAIKACTKKQVGK